MASRLKTHWPTLLTFILTVAYVSIRLSLNGMNPVELMEIGTQFSEQDPDGTEGYDGQFVYYAALDLAPAGLEEKLDDPAYRYQRILLPLFGHMLGQGEPTRTAWALLVINVFAHCAGTWAVSELMGRHGWPRGYAIIYGLWVGLVLSVGLGLHEPLAYALVAVAILLFDHNHRSASAVVAMLAVFAKETTILFWLGLLAAEIFQRRSWKVFAVFTSGAIGFVIWQIWLAAAFGSAGFGVGGGGATGFDWVPLNGLWRIGMHNLRALLVYAVAFGPAIVVPAVWGLIAACRTLLEDMGRADAYMLAANSAAIIFLPHSSFREPLGLIRFADGLVLALLYFAAVSDRRRAMRYAVLWTAMLVLILNG
ncbi:MAG: hypothetical protein JXA97_05630 [Anaerolineales bacterium]|nr:hypothetical protein [Anaerolineales bacterium]